METLRNYQEVLSENKRFLNGTPYPGYLTQENRREVARLFPELNKTLSGLRDQLNNQVGAVAKSASFSAINHFNNLIKKLSELGKRLEQEPDRPFYSLSEIPHSTAVSVVREDQEIFETLSAFEIEVSDILRNGIPEEEDIERLSGLFTSLETGFAQREETIQESETLYDSIQSDLKQVEHSIDTRDMENLETTLDEIFELSDGLLRPHLDVLNTLKDRQIFIYRRAERAIERDDAALRFYDIYVEYLERLQHYLETYQETLQYSPYFSKFEQISTLLPKMRQKRDELYRISSPSNEIVEEEEGDAEQTGSGGHTSRILFVVGAILVIAMLAFFLIS